MNRKSTAPPRLDAEDANSARLRQRAEAAVHQLEPREAPADDSRKILHELRVHQIELEMQNEELHRTQVELETERARYVELYDTAPVGYCTISGTGQVQEANLTAATLLGLPRSSLAGQQFAKFIRGEDAGIYHYHRQGFLAADRPFECDLRMVRKDGTDFWAHLAATPGRDARSRCHLVLSDITERKLASENLQERLEEQVRQRTADLSETVEALRLSEQALLEANQRKDEFLGLLAHELRNPLAPIRTGAYILGTLPNQDPKAQQIHEMIIRQSAQMARLVDDLLDISRIERGKVELRKQRVDLGEVLAHAMEACKPLLEAQEHRLVLGQPGALQDLEADPIRLEQMLCNLMSNACKFTPAGGEIRVSTAREGTDAVVRIRDNGVGMTPEAVTHGFDLFYQAGQAMDQPHSGLGIGLTLVRKLAQLHGGSVTACSEGLGTGSEFTLRLPALEPAQERPAAGLTPGPAQAGRKRHVLVIDDNDHVRITSGMLLEALDYRVTLAATGLRGIELAKALRPDIALIDLGMPGLDGLEVAARIRADLGQSIYLVALTGYSRENDIASTKAAGFDKHLVKSGDPRELLDLLSGIR